LKNIEQRLFEIEFTKKLKQCDFPYEVPIALSTNDGNETIEYNGKLVCFPIT